MKENTKIEKTVLIVDDETRICETVKWAFTDLHEKNDCSYVFQVDIAHSASECVKKVRQKDYDIIVLDVHMEQEASGLKIADQLNKEVASPIRIILTGYPKYSDCVEAVRNGVWDYIIKEDIGEKSMGEALTDSAMARLCQLDMHREQEEKIAVEWLPQHFSELQEQHGGELIALWHQPEAHIIATGIDSFDLEANLVEWRKAHTRWEQPWIVRIPRLCSEEEV